MSIGAIASQLRCSCGLLGIQMKGELLQNDDTAVLAASRTLNSVLSCDNMPSVMLSPLKYNILELEISKMDRQRYFLKIHCEKAPGVLVQLTKALEALDVEIVSAFLASFSHHIVNNIVVKLEEEEVVEAKELKNMVFKVTSKFGLHYHRFLV